MFTPAIKNPDTVLNLSIKQKLLYIKRYADIIDEDTARNIYNTVRKTAGETAIRATQSDQGVYLNVSDLDDELIDTIYSIIKRRVELIVLR